MIGYRHTIACQSVNKVTFAQRSCCRSLTRSFFCGVYKHALPAPERQLSMLPRVHEEPRAHACIRNDAAARTCRWEDIFAWLGETRETRPAKYSLTRMPAGILRRNFLGIRVGKVRTKKLMNAKSSPTDSADKRAEWQLAPVCKRIMPSAISVPCGKSRKPRSSAGHISLMREKEKERGEKESERRAAVSPRGVLCGFGYHVPSRAMTLVLFATAAERPMLLVEETPCVDG